jgi:hypothetical protein
VTLNDELQKPIILLIFTPLFHVNSPNFSQQGSLADDFSLNIDRLVQDFYHRSSNPWTHWIWRSLGESRDGCQSAKGEFQGLKKHKEISDSRYLLIIENGYAKKICLNGMKLYSRSRIDKKYFSFAIS